LHLLAFGFGAGLAPKAPGTFGTLVGVLIYLPLAHLPFWWYLALTLLAILAGVGICGWSSRKLGVHDHPGIVWDEIAGYLVTMLWAPPGWAWVLAGFVLFRLFDILKPWPIGWFDRRVRGGFGIMLDDVLAGLAALGCMQLLANLLPLD
jgi:phosphatidylglycerophosphatase A